ncbi:Hypothetical protein CINCED_3A020437 [Cinara cedri]|uniref:Uncharacterized protein n=1 Tax=Cinara cedri TaxID=506608 RepID=A0A5E4MLU8_9HEMI|nr:Hypothetical protein CINCED_3A020437 [Cinara cedri]
MKQIFMKDSFKDQNSEFSLGLCRAFLDSDIPLWKLHNTTFNTFLKKYTEICEGPIYVSIDETTDVDGRYVANVIIGLMHEEKCPKSYLLICEELSKNIQNDLAYIKSNLGFITQSILKLENASFLLDENSEIVENTKSKLGQNKGPIAEKIDKKLKNADSGLDRLNNTNITDEKLISCSDRWANLQHAIKTVEESLQISSNKPKSTGTLLLEFQEQLNMMTKKTSNETEIPVLSKPNYKWIQNAFGIANAFIMDKNIKKSSDSWLNIEPR